MGHLETHAHEYETVRECLSPPQMLKLIYKIQTSGRFALGELSHIYARGTNICVGYLGDESAELVDSNRAETKALRKKLKSYFNSV